jgi:hypothetical protein
MKRSSLIFGIGSLMITSLVAQANTYKSFCFHEHIKDSISINKERKKVYSVLTNGKSNQIYNEFIAFEYLTSALTPFYDLQALSYQKQGINLFCDEFMNLIRNPDFDPNHRQMPAETFQKLDWKYHHKKIREAIKRKDVSEVKKVTLEALVEIKSLPNYYCLTRHFYESIYRFAHFVPLRVKQAEEKSLQNPTDLMFRMMKLQALGLRGSYGIDVKSSPIQLSGIPMICSEIPPLLNDLKNIELDVLRNK